MMEQTGNRHGDIFRDVIQDVTSDLKIMIENMKSCLACRKIRFHVFPLTDAGSLNIAGANLNRRFEGVFPMQVIQPQIAQTERVAISLPKVFEYPQ